MKVTTWPNDATALVSMLRLLLKRVVMRQVNHSRRETECCSFILRPEDGPTHLGTRIMSSFRPLPDMTEKFQGCGYSVDDNRAPSKIPMVGKPYFFIAITRWEHLIH